MWKNIYIYNKICENVKSHAWFVLSEISEVMWFPTETYEYIFKCMLYYWRNKLYVLEDVCLLYVKYDYKNILHN